MAASCASKFDQIPDALWSRIEPLLPIYQNSCKGGRPRLSLRKVVTGIVYVLRTGSQWKAMPREFGSGSAVHSYFQEWTQQGVFENLWREALLEYDDLKGIDWEWQSLDGAMNKAPLGGEKNRKKPDRSRENRRQAFGVDRRSRRAVGGGSGGGQCPRPEAREGDTEQHSGAAAEAVAA